MGCICQGRGLSTRRAVLLGGVAAGAPLTAMAGHADDSLLLDVGGSQRRSADPYAAIDGSANASVGTP
jgi:hypothetical protein